MVCVVCVCVVCECMLCGVCAVCVGVCVLCVCVCAVCSLMRVVDRAVYGVCVCASRREGRCRRGAGWALRGFRLGERARAWPHGPLRRGRERRPGQQGPPEKAAARGRGSGTGGEPSGGREQREREEGCLAGLMSGLAEFC